MSTTDTRAAFEAWMREEYGADDDMLKRPYEDRYFWPRAADAWAGWQAATEAAKATGTAGEIDADAEMAKVKRDVELMGVGFLVDGKRCSLDRITWFNRPGDTWLPPPPGYPTEAARQPAPVVSNDLRNAAQLIMDLYDDMRMGKQAIPAFDALRAALAATAAPVLSDEVIHALWNIAWDVAIKEAGVCIGNADVAHMRQPVVFARLLSDATAINAAIQAQKGE